MKKVLAVMIVGIMMFGGVSFAEMDPNEAQAVAQIVVELQAFRSVLKTTNASINTHTQNIADIISDNPDCVSSAIKTKLTTHDTNMDAIKDLGVTEYNLLKTDFKNLK